MINARTMLALALLVPMAGPAQSQGPVLADIHDLTPRQHVEKGFVLPANGAIRLDAVGAEPRWDKGQFGSDDSTTWPAAAWILNARTREVVWDLRTATTDRSRNGLHQFHSGVSLPAGLYELHYASYPGAYGLVSGTIIDKAKNLLRGSSTDEAIYSGPYVDDGLYHQFGVKVSGAGRAATEAELAAARQDHGPDIVVSLHPVDTSEVKKVAFSLSHAAAVEVAAVGEIIQTSPVGDGGDDYGWIIDADTHRTVWRMNWSGSHPAGGAAKNRLERLVVQLRPGRYVAYFSTDNSHDPSNWNAVPPLDPAAWGMTLRIADAAGRAGFKPIDWQPVPPAMLASITRVGNNETRKSDFSLRQPTDVRIYALGEASGNEMADYAWLIDVDTHQRVWVMRRNETEPAGGAVKNREYDGTLHLAAGNYRLYYTSDDSHAFGHWNDSPPPEREYWGVSLWPVNGKIDVATGPVSRQPAIKPLASLTHVGNNMNIAAPFHLDADGNVRVYSIGEGSGGSMDDYAWIEDARTGRTVWEMTYKMTDHAGGAEKNREFNGTVFLKAGSYRLGFKSDGSHSWGDWNAAPPDDPDGWGATVTPVHQ